MNTSTISIEEISTLSKLGRIAVRHSAEFGQTPAGAHCAISDEKRVVIDLSPTGFGVISGTDVPLYAAAGAGEGRVFFDPKTGRAWWGPATTIRVLDDGDSPLEGGTVVKDAANAAYQRALLSGAA